MEKRDIKSQITKNMAKHGLPLEDLRIQLDPYGGWRIAVVSSGFEGLSFYSRKDIVFEGLDPDLFEWVDLLTPEELEWAGELPIEMDIEDIPLWPQALARTEPPPDTVFPSDLDEDLERPIVTTFYSLRGGVGRSTALVYTAYLLAKRGHSVLCVDLDLEAPGLSALFGKESEVRPDMGVLSVILGIEQGMVPDFLDHVIRVTESYELYCMPAGVPNADYARRLGFLSPEVWYRQESNPLRTFMDMFKREDNLLKPDIVLLDARTGISPINGPLLFDLCDVAVICFFPNSQSQTGTKELVKALLRSKSRRVIGGRNLTPEPRFLVSPVPPREVERYQHRAEEWIEEWISDAVESFQDLNELEVGEIVHVVPYREVLATSDRLMESGDALTNYEKIADWIVKFLPTDTEMKLEVETMAQMKGRILEGLSFSTGAAELQDDFLDTFVATEIFQKASSPGRPLVVGRKGTGKTALFRWILESKKLNPVVVMCPAPFRKDFPWVPAPDGFRAISAQLKSGAGWREFWALYIALACYQQMKLDQRIPGPPEQLRTILEAVLVNTTESELIYAALIGDALQIPIIGLLAWQWLRDIDRNLKTDAFLLFDGLDTGFGNSEDDRERRKEALEGLFAFILDRGSSLDKLKFKVLIRADIWAKLAFENKSHIDLRSVRLEWKSKADYIKTVLKQALRNPEFRKLAKQTGRPDVQLPIEYASEEINVPIEYWPEEVVFDAWNLLVGERMKGAKSTYTVNWVWNRLSDGNNDHSPRALFELLRTAKEWEIENQRMNPYDRSIIRPKALSHALKEVSRQSLQSLLEEFEELSRLITVLPLMQRSPFEEETLKNELRDEFAEQISLALEVGLLETYDEYEDHAKRYRVPDLYRIALDLTRKGQA